MKDERESRLPPDDADAKKLESLRASEADYIREGPAPLRSIDALPPHYLVPIWCAMAAVIVHVKSRHLPAAPALVFCVSLVTFALALTRSNSFYEEIRRYSLIEPSKASYVVWIAKPGRLALYRSWARIAFAIFASYVAAIGILPFLRTGGT